MRKRLFTGLLALVCASCGGSTENAGADPEALSDEGTGADVDTPDPGPEVDACIDNDVCAELADIAVESPALRVDALGPDAVGTRLLVLAYAPMRKYPNGASALVTSIAGGIPRDSLHLWGQPAGYVPPGQVVTLASTTSTNGYWKVTYDGHSGWVLGKKVTLADTGSHPIAFAMRSGVRNAFFKHQIHRSVWNKDGPSHSGNCAPTSLAMALHVLGEEPADKSIEESIHRVRLAYGMHSDSGPTSRSEIRHAALAFGMQVHDLGARVSPAASLRRLADQLALHRVVVLEGMPGQAGSTPTVYQAAMDRAYAAAIKAGNTTLYHSKYTFDGFHAIFVLGRDASGDYVVGDPLSEVGFVALTPREMEDFMTRWGGTGTAVWR